MLTLGINTDWLANAAIDADLFVQAVSTAVEAVESGVIPGAVLYADRIAQIMMPVGVGYQITHPERRRVVYDQRYELHELTGPLVTVPLALQTISSGRLDPKAKLGTLLTAFSDSDKAELTVEQLLRHTSGFPSSFDIPGGLLKKEEIPGVLLNLPLDAEPQPSIANWLLLGMIVESIEGKTLEELAQTALMGRFDLHVSTFGVVAENRGGVAPGPYDEKLGRMAWGDARDPFAMVWHGPPARSIPVMTMDYRVVEPWAVKLAPHYGLVSAADDLGTLARTLLIPAVAGQFTTWDSAPAVSKYLILPTDDQSRNWGFETGRHAAGTIGWDARQGSSFWMVPARQGFVLFLCNAEHPAGIHPQFEQTRAEIIGLLLKAMDHPWPATSIDAAP
jgi:CubicO group peptidase (beta-lactamase class C family)